MSGGSSELKQRIKRALIEELDLRGKTEADIDDAAPLFGEGLGLDSLDALQLAMAIENFAAFALIDDTRRRQRIYCVGGRVARASPHRGERCRARVRTRAIVRRYLPRADDR